VKARPPVKAKRTRFLIAAAVVAIHGGLCWLLLQRSKIAVLPTMSKSLELIFLPAPAVPRERSPGQQTSHRPASKPRAARQAPVGPPTDPQSEQSNAIHPPIDWHAELAREANDSAAASPRQYKDFGVPASPLAPSSSRPAFGWDYAATHRVQSISGGGVLVNLNDNCVLIFNPLPFFFCRPGHKPANGDLFKEMIPPSLSEGDGAE
jgi:hypothetical protein